jgi:hypothetical protein
MGPQINLSFRSRAQTFDINYLGEQIGPQMAKALLAVLVHLCFVTSYRKNFDDPPLSTGLL